MVYVRLAREWTDGAGAAHGAGDMLDVDAVTLAELEADGVVAAAGPDGPDPDWAGPTLPEPKPAPKPQPPEMKAGWAGPTLPEPERHAFEPAWAGPTAPRPAGPDDPDWAGPTDPPPPGDPGTSGGTGV